MPEKGYRFAPSLFCTILDLLLVKTPLSQQHTKILLILVILSCCDTSPKVEAYKKGIVSMKELPKIYDPKAVEEKIYDLWLKGKYFEGKRDPEKDPLP
jgi:hypothetical protein